VEWGKVECGFHKNIACLRKRGKVPVERETVETRFIRKKGADGKGRGVRED